MVDVLKVNRLIENLQKFASELESIQDFRLHQQVDQFYYMQKTAQLIVLRENVEDAKAKFERVTTQIETVYQEVFCKWRSDVRKLSPYLIHGED